VKIVFLKLVASILVYTAAYFTVSCSNPLPGIAYREMVSVPGGKTFNQTSASGLSESFDHTVSGFLLAKYETTYELWYTVMQWAVGHGYSFAYPGIEGQDAEAGHAPTAYKHEPVTTVNWRDAITWCNAYSEMDGLAPVYYTNGEMTKVLKRSGGGTEATRVDTNPGTSDNPFVKWDAHGYRLPTEGEWQYAASYIDGKIWTPFNFASGAGADYTNAAETEKVAWYNDSNVSANTRTTATVGTKAANQLGVYDMSGNVHEFCWDWYAPYPASAKIDYRGPETGSYRVVHGTSWSVSAMSLQVGSRGGFHTYKASTIIGFRVARSK
jgi:formylglycine-generating enzyme required for sulfatase activity